MHHSMQAESNNHRPNSITRHEHERSIQNPHPAAAGGRGHDPVHPSKPSLRARRANLRALHCDAQWSPRYGQDQLHDRIRRLLSGGLAASLQFHLHKLGRRNRLGWTASRRFAHDASPGRSGNSTPSPGRRRPRCRRSAQTRPEIRPSLLRCSVSVTCSDVSPFRPGAEFIPTDGGPSGAYL